MPVLTISHLICILLFNCIFKNCPGEIWLYNLTMVQTDVNVKVILEVHHKPDMISREH